MTHHKQKALYLLSGFFIGVVLTYFMLGHIVAYRVKEAFDIGVETGFHFQQNPDSCLIKN